MGVLNMRIIITHTKYFEKFIKMLMNPANRDKKGEQIYDELELWHIGKTGYRKCKDYASFRSLKSQWYKRNS